MGKRIYKQGVPQHVCIRGKNSGIVFYCLEDCIYYVTLHTCLAQKHGIVTNAFALMPNHTHSEQMAPDRRSFSLFNKEMSLTFTLGYNRQHCRKGPLFDSPFESFPKSTGKLIKSNLSYICNNGAEGKLSKGVLDFRWNMVAYLGSDYPFSGKPILRHASKQLRRAIKLVSYCRENLIPLGYAMQGKIYKGLNALEKRQITDFILSQYNPVDKRCMIKFFGSLKRAVTAMETNCGSEYDIKEDWDNYSIYSKLGLRVKEKGFDLKTVNFEGTNQEKLLKLRRYLKKTTEATERQLDKFLHMTR